MDPEKTLTFCLGLKAEEMTISLHGLDRTEAATVAVSQEADTPTMAKSNAGPGSISVASPQYCPGVNNGPGYLCETGHCCGETDCCTYYYELWWFWMLWMLLIIFCCFCVFRHRRIKLRTQQEQRQREINLIAYNEACTYPSSMLDLSFLASFKLPSYEEVAAQPTTPPPPYSSVFALQGSALGGPSVAYPHHHLHRHPCPPYLGPAPGRSALTSSQSSDYTSCSCESCSLTSPCSTSFSVQVTDDMYDSSRVSTPSEAGPAFALAPSSPVPPDVVPAVAPDVVPVQRRPSYGSDWLPALAPPLSLSRPPRLSRLPLSPLNLLSSLPPGQAHVLTDPLGVAAAAPRRGTEQGCSARHPLFPPSAAAALGKQEQKQVREEEVEEDEEDEDEDHFRHRRLTGDSGIEVCRCRVKREEPEEEELRRGKGAAPREAEGPDLLHDSVDCSLRAARSPLPDDCGGQHRRLHPSSSDTVVVQKAAEAIITVDSL
ncbi:uncharacterized protein LOC142891834 isoform X2 [Nelusetta ayraudi]|uniref:uncharacterized protein LOC142891834 isoform X2 n=2 Tax=Nelusetta ayraudi TaxID=303726 RepID=UPI003F700A0D